MGHTVLKKPGGAPAAPPAYDSAGPGAVTTTVANSSWTHTPVGTPSCVIVIVSIAAGTALPTARTRTATYGGVTMTSLGEQYSNGTTGTSLGAWVQMWYLLSPPSGAQTVAVSCSGTVSRTVANSYAFTGVTAVGTAVKAFWTGTSSGHPDQVIVPSTATGIIIAGHIGDDVLSAASGTDRYHPAVVSNTAAASRMDQTKPGTGSNVTMSCTITGTSVAWATMGVGLS